MFGKWVKCSCHGTLVIARTARKSETYVYVCLQCTRYIYIDSIDRSVSRRKYGTFEGPRSMFIAPLRLASFVINAAGQVNAVAHAGRDSRGIVYLVKQVVA